MRKAALLILSLGLVAGCGEAIDEADLGPSTKAAPPAAPAPAPAVQETPQPTGTVLDICLNAATDTVATNGCYETEVSRRSEELDRYLAAARAKIAEEKSDVAPFNAAQASWAAYSEAYCDAVYERWKDGTIRSAMGAACKIEVTADRSHQLWKDYLTSSEGGAPVLPEPVR